MAKKPKKSKIITKKQFDRWSPEKRQRALNDRRTRIRIEDKALPKEWLDRRNRARWNRTPITEGSSTTYGDLEKQRKYLEPLTFGEGDRQLADRGENIGLARQRDASWFEKYRADVQAAQQAAIGAQTAAAQGNQAFIDSANQVSASSRDAIVKQLQDRAAQLGQTDQSAEYRGLADAAAATRAAGMANTAQRQVADANAGVNLATAGVGTAALKDLEAQGYRDYQDRLLQKDKSGFASKKDEWRAKFIDDAIAEARKQVLEDRVFQLNAADKAADNKRADASLSIAERRLREQRRAARERERLARERESRQAASGGGGGGNKSSGPKPATPKETRTQASAIRRAVTLVKGYRAQKKPTGEIRQGLAVMGIDTDVVNTAMDIVYLGGIGKVNRRRWKKAGYNPRDFGQPFK